MVGSFWSKMSLSHMQLMASRFYFAFVCSLMTKFKGDPLLKIGV